MIEWNKVIYADCMNDKNGLSTLGAKSVDLCLTDPPYGIKDKRVRGKKVINYNDARLNMDWWNEMLRISDRIIFFGGYKNIGYLLTNYPVELAIWNNPINQGTSKNANMNRITPMFTYNLKLPVNIIRLIPMDRPMGFYNGKRCMEKIHPHPKDSIIIDWIINVLRPNSIIDPFLGSGTTAEACKRAGIKWLGYEINEVYSQDINKRLKNCKKEPKQIELIL